MSDRLHTYNSDPHYELGEQDATIKKLRAALSDITQLDYRRLTGRQKYDLACDLAKRALKE